jgi:hypothetical protein
MAWKKQMAARTFRCGHPLYSRARVRTGRCQQAHHQMVLIERMFMAKIHSREKPDAQLI